MTSQSNSASEWRKVKQKLEQKTNADLIRMIQSLYEGSRNNEIFIKASVFKDLAAVETYKSIITDAIYLDTNDRNCQIEFSKARKAISDFKRANGDTKCLLDLMIHFVETGTEQTNGILIDYWEYYSSLESMFKSILKRLTGTDKKYADCFIPRLEAIIKNSSNTGFGFQETIQGMYDKAFASRLC